MWAIIFKSLSLAALWANWISGKLASAARAMLQVRRYSKNRRKYVNNGRQRKGNILNRKIKCRKLANMLEILIYEILKRPLEVRTHCNCQTFILLYMHIFFVFMYGILYINKLFIVGLGPLQDFLSIKNYLFQAKISLLNQS